MAIEHDGISCRLPPRPLALLLGVAGLAAAGWLFTQGNVGAALGLGLVSPLILINELGKRRVKVIVSRLLVEDERLLRMLLLGPARTRWEWPEVQAVKVEGRSLRVESTRGVFHTAQGADPAELAQLVEKIETARAAFSQR